MLRLTFFAALAALLTAFAPGIHAQGSPIEPEKAFAMSARALDPHTVQVDFRVHPDYYLYGDKFRFATDPPEVRLGEPVRAQGEMKNDEFFGLVEILRGPVSILLPVESAPDGLTAFNLTVTSQGCWDGGVCYPPTPQSIRIDLANPGGGGGTSLLQRALGRAGSNASPAVPATPTAAAVEGDESGRIAGLLSGANLPLVLTSFFGFGLLLAFTPCHFPMIPILSGIIVGQGTGISRMRAFVLSLAYVLGMAVTYAAAGIAAGLSGTLLSAALQNAWVLGAFALVFVLLALSMFGFYELQLPTTLQSRLADRAAHRKGGSIGGVAVMGALSALIVGPCVAAPLAGALLYIAQTGDALLGGLALFVMALGSGLPLLAVGVVARSALPKAGPWMEGIKKAFGVMLLAVAIWLLTPVAPELLTMLAWAALLLFSGIFLRALDPLPPHAHGWQRFWKGFGVMLLLAGAAILAGALAGSRDPLRPLAVLRAGADMQTASPVFEPIQSAAELDARLAATDRPAMLDFYADWCVSCKEMERYTFTDPAVAARMERMLLLKADVTGNTDEHKALLRRFNLFGPPGTIFFDPDGQEHDGLRVVGFMKAEPFGKILDRTLR